MAEKEEIGKVKLRQVRLSFPHIDKPQAGRPDPKTGLTPEPRFNCSLLIPKNGDDIQKANLKALKAAKEGVMAGKWPKGDVKLKAEKLCTRDGDEESYDGYEGMFFVSCGSTQDKPPEVLDNRRDKEGKWVRLTNGEGFINGGAAKMYAGCYVNAIVRLWAQDNVHGKRVNATLEVVQFYGHGEAFGATRASGDDEFGDEDVGEAEEIADVGDAEDLI